jgi:hypothetical protein
MVEVSGFLDKVACESTTKDLGRTREDDEAMGEGLLEGRERKNFSC